MNYSYERSCIKSSYFEPLVFVVGQFNLTDNFPIYNLQGLSEIKRKRWLINCSLEDKTTESESQIKFWEEWQEKYDEIIKQYQELEIIKMRKEQKLIKKYVRQV